MTVSTPLYVLSEEVLRSRIRAYWAAFRAADSNCQLAFAAKANSTFAVLKICASEGLMIDVASEGELESALRAGVAADRCYLHGSNKSRREMNLAMEVGVDHIVADNWDDLHYLDSQGCSIPIMLRMAPGVDPVTHEKVRTGQGDTKFGFPLNEEELDRLGRYFSTSKLSYWGIHCHVGSQLVDPSAQKEGGETIARAAGRLRGRYGLEARVVNIGGGLATAYTDQDRPNSMEEYNWGVCPAVRAVMDEVAPRAVLMQEPGRSLVADAGVTLYTIGRIKQIILGDRVKTYVSVDGGLADNPRPALYGSEYTVKCLRSGENLVPYTISGRHCETDLLFDEIELPDDLAVGDVLQVLSTGAYNSSMASNYNRYPRPVTVLIRSDGRRQVVQQSETFELMFSREYVPEDLA